MTRYDIINKLIEKYKYNSYLEIGVADGDCFQLIHCGLKHGVDPDSICATHHMKSNEFFEKSQDTYDIIFIDGLHLVEQVTKDIENSLLHMFFNGTIVIHDCLPKEKIHQERKAIWGKPWTGDVWKSFAELRFARADLNMLTIDCDWGCGIIRNGKQKTLLKPPLLEWEYFLNNKYVLMNIKTEKEWCSLEGWNNDSFQN